MRGKALFFAGIFAFLVGCASHLNYEKSSKSDIPWHKRKMPTLEKVIIIDPQGPQLDPTYYQVMGKAEGKVSHVTALLPHCKDAIEMLRYETENVGGDALIDVSCTSDAFTGTAQGTVISFKSRVEALKALKEIKAILK